MIQTSEAILCTCLDILYLNGWKLLYKFESYVFCSLRRSSKGRSKPRRLVGKSMQKKLAINPTTSGIEFDMTRVKLEDEASWSSITVLLILLRRQSETLGVNRADARNTERERNA